MKTIILEPFTSIDFDRLISWVESESILYQFAGPIFSYPLTFEQLENYVSDVSRMVFKVLDKENGQVLGHCELGMIDKQNNKARVCRILVAAESNRGKGLGKQIIDSLLHIGFDELNLHRIDLGVFDFNHAAIRCYEQCGFQKEGLLRDSFILDGQYCSIYNMSILCSEWER